VERLLSDLNVQREFPADSVSDALIARMADEAIRSGMHLTNPRPADRDDIRKIFAELFQG
jgi:alcohol dehydrogenase class IV